MKVCLNTALSFTKLLSAGGDVELFWRKWATHFESKEVMTTLEQTKIGDLSVCYDYGDNDTYRFEPRRDCQLRYHDFVCVTPVGTQTRPEILRSNFLTPNDAFHIQNHAPVPSHLSENHDIIFSIDNGSSRDIIKSCSINDIATKFAKKNIVSVLQCAGNRQYDDFCKMGVNGFSGTPFEKIRSGMVGNAMWSGVRLDELLRSIFPDECREEDASPGSWHVIFTGADEFESSTPLHLVIQANTDGLLAFEMNGKPLTLDHGYPVRIILPGYVGVRNIKWLEVVSLSRTPSSSPWTAHYYRDHNQQPIQILPLNSIIFSPDKHTIIQLNEAGQGSASVQGVAYSGASNSSIDSVEVTADGGKTWIKAKAIEGREG